VGESGTLTVAAVVASAIEDALSARGVRLDEVPLMPARLHRRVHRQLGAWAGPKPASIPVRHAGPPGASPPAGCD
jgi:hypothetical protein